MHVRVRVRVRVPVAWLGTPLLALLCAVFFYYILVYVLFHYLLPLDWFLKTAAYFHRVLFSISPKYFPNAFFQLSSALFCFSQIQAWFLWFWKKCVALIFHKITETSHFSESEILYRIFFAFLAMEMIDKLSWHQSVLPVIFRTNEKFFSYRRFKFRTIRYCICWRIRLNSWFETVLPDEFQKLSKNFAIFQKLNFFGYFSFSEANEGKQNFKSSKVCCQMIFLHFNT